jgi:putative sigma-54 modulation protein
VVVHLAGRGVTVSPTLQRRVEAKIAKMQRVLPKLIETRVVLARERYRHLAEVTLQAKGTTFHVDSAAPSFEAALDQALAHLVSQVRRRKDRVTGHRKPGAARRPSAPRSAAGGRSESADEPPPASPPSAPVVRRTSVKPMSLEEAVDQLRLRDDDLLVFRNARTRAVNVLRRRPDGTVELVEPAG